MLSQSPPELRDLLGPGLLELMPFNVAIIDRQYRIVAANRNFEEYFGPWRGLHCHEVCKGMPARCATCQAEATFTDGRTRVSNETGVDRHGRACHYVVHLAPLRDGEGNINFVLEMTTDVTETTRWQREYDLLFERVPCYVSIIDRNFRVVRANEKFREVFGESDGQFCYQLYKRRRTPCGHCPAALTFKDRREHVSEQVGIRQDGSLAHYVVTTTPLVREGEVAHVIEIATDITEVRSLQEKLKEAHNYYESLIRNAALAIVALDCDDNVRILNPAARRLLEWDAARLPTAARLRQLLPAAFFRPFDDMCEEPDTEISTTRGNKVPVALTAIGLTSSGKCLGRAAFLQDLREIKRLEREKLDAERLGAVGQTVAGLAHTIKNLLMGLEGGMYMVDSGLRRGDAGRIASGWEVLQRNFEKTTSLVKDFLSFAKGRLPELEPADPNALAAEIVELYRDAALRQGVELVLEAGAEVHPAPLDRKGIETCLTNLVSNGIDAAVMRGQPGGRVVLRTREADGDLLFEVADNGCGMDWEVKGKVFTTFFTTKGGKGTGLGLLTTRKIVQEHGGRIDVESSPQQGSLFRIRLPRKRLEALAAPDPVPAGPTGS